MLEPRVRPFKSRDALLRTIRSFLLLRPVISLRFLRAIWYAYLIIQTYRLFWWMWMVLAPPAGWAQVGLSAMSATYPLLNILLVRVLLEVAAVVLCGRAFSGPEQQDGKCIPAG